MYKLYLSEKLSKYTMKKKCERLKKCKIIALGKQKNENALNKIG